MIDNGFFLQNEWIIMFYLDSNHKTIIIRNEEYLFNGEIIIHGED